MLRALKVPHLDRSSLTFLLSGLLLLAAVSLLSSHLQPSLPQAGDQVFLR